VEVQTLADIGNMKLSELKNIIREEYSSASKLYEIEGVIVIDTDTAFHKQIMSDVRAVKGITIVKDYIYEPVGAAANRGYADLVIKIDPSPFKQMKVQDIVNQVVNDIKSVKGVRAFKVKKGPFQVNV
jgi:hypothetical protein